MESIEQFHGMKMLGAADRLTFKGGQWVQMSQVAARQWKNGKIALERFYYED